MRIAVGESESDSDEENGSVKQLEVEISRKGQSTMAKEERLQSVKVSNTEIEQSPLTDTSILGESKVVLNHSAPKACKEVGQSKHPPVKLLDLKQCQSESSPSAGGDSDTSLEHTSGSMHIPHL